MVKRGGNLERFLTHINSSTACTPMAGSLDSPESYRAPKVDIHPL